MTEEEKVLEEVTEEKGVLEELSEQLAEYKDLLVELEPFKAAVARQQASVDAEIGPIKDWYDGVKARTKAAMERAHDAYDDATAEMQVSLRIVEKKIEELVYLAQEADLLKGSKNVVDGVETRITYTRTPVVKVTDHGALAAWLAEQEALSLATVKVTISPSTRDWLVIEAKKAKEPIPGIEITHPHSKKEPRYSVKLALIKEEEKDG